MRVNVRFFAAAREAAGREGDEVALAPGATLRTLRAALLERHPGLAAVARASRWADERTFLEDDAALADGQTVALIPPVSGG